MEQHYTLFSPKTKARFASQKPRFNYNWCMPKAENAKHRLKTIIWSTACALAWSLAAAAEPAPPLSPLASGPAIDRIDGTKIFFKEESKPLGTDLHEIKPLGWLNPGEGSQPWLLLSAKPCQSCPQDTAVYMLRKDGSKRTHFVFPGRVNDPKSGESVLKSRAFYGKCLSGRGDVYVVVQEEKVDRRRGMQKSVFVAEPGKDIVNERLHERGYRSMERDAIRLANAKPEKRSCHEIEGKSRLISRKPLDLNPRRGDDLDDNTNSDEDDTPKENQTQTELPAAQD